MNTPEQHRSLRRPVYQRLGISDKAIEYLLNLEINQQDTVISTLQDLSRTPAWNGRRATLPNGTTLIRDGPTWRILL